MKEHSRITWRSAFRALGYVTVLLCATWFMGFFFVVIVMTYMAFDYMTEGILSASLGVIMLLYLLFVTATIGLWILSPWTWRKSKQ